LVYIQEEAVTDQHIVTSRMFAVQAERLRINSDSGQSLLLIISSHNFLKSVSKSASGERVSPALF
jgi:hypothetical protein